MVAANRRDPNNLIGAAIVSTPVRDHNVIFVSFDAGNSWRTVDLPEVPEDGTGNAQVAFDNEGLAYFSVLGQSRNKSGDKQFQITLFRSRDGGRTWAPAGSYGTGNNPDHDQMTVDNSSSIYTTCLCHFPDGEWAIGLFISNDHGSATSGPIKVASAPPDMAVFNLNPVALSDGSLFVPYYVFQQGELQDRHPPASDIYYVIRSNRFSAPTKIHTQLLDPYARIPSPYVNVVFAADTRSGRFPDRIYMLTAEAVSGRYRLKLSYSTDRGKTWSEPKEIAPNSSESPYQNQYQPQIYVNREGVVGMTWFDTRDFAKGTSYHEYFTASLDGGESFLPSVKVSTQVSPLEPPISKKIIRHTIDSPGRTKSGDIIFSFISAAESHPTGGDYMGLTADEKGIFHAFWSDTRTGSFQAWTAAIKVQLGTDISATDILTSSSEIVAVPRTEDAVLTAGLEPVFDPSTLDNVTGIEEIPIRFKNVSDRPLCTAFKAQLVQPTETKNPATVLNSDKGRSWSGAEFDYSASFGDLKCLAPGSVTEAITWRLKLADPSQTFVTLKVKIVNAGRQK